MNNLNKILAFDALTCALMGVVLTVAAPALSVLLALPQDLLSYAGFLLFPIAAFMALLARQAAPWPAGVWLVILGNAAWVAASLAVLVAAGPNFLGVAFITVQALAVAGLALAELKARHPAAAASGAAR